MATVLSQEVSTRHAVSGTLGKQLLDVITSGMYSDPRMALREYIQNAADSIDQAHAQGAYARELPRIQITVDGSDRIITVEDNGTGLNAIDVERRLGSLGCSPKLGSGQRGFRGIGRLGGMAYCDNLKFETRRSHHEPVHVVEWNGQALRDRVACTSDHEQLADAVRRIAFSETRHAVQTADSHRFFRVQMFNVHRFHSDPLMHVKGLREYLSQVAPVGYNVAGFRFAEQIESFLAEVPGFRSYPIELNGVPIVRPYVDDFEGREGLTDTIRDLELVECKSRDGKLLCRGWFAQTKFLSALPPHIAMRGLRVRQGNIAVGDEFFLKDLFSESRFATWHIGELHTTPALKLNARRDGFEASSEYEDFLEWATMLCRRLSGLCRQSSSKRSTRQSFHRISEELEQMASVAFFVDEAHAAAFSQTARRQLERLKKVAELSEKDTQELISIHVSRFEKIQKRSVFLHDVLDGRALRHKNNRQILVEVCKRILETNSDKHSTALIMGVVSPYLRR